MDIRKYRISTNFQKLAQEIDFNVSLDARANVDFSRGSTEPRIQADVVIKGGEIQKIVDKCVNIIKQDIYKKEDFPYTLTNWVYIVDRDSPEGANYHNHTKMKHINTKGEWSFVYYVTMPDKLEGDDGYIYFKDKKEVISFIPEVGELLIFPAELLHFPKVNPLSEEKRRVIAGTISKCEYKSEKTFL